MPKQKIAELPCRVFALERLKEIRIGKKDDQEFIPQKCGECSFAKCGWVVV
ncbi:MAG: hypothetical protein ABIA37_02205 [Candidatus Woesearchaeota archaeon]